MKHRWLAVLTLLTSVAVAHGPEDPVDSHQEGTSTIGLSQKEISYEDYIVKRTRELNSQKSLPDLSYGGVQGAEWGVIREDVLKNMSATAVPYKKQKGAWHIKSKNGKMAELPFELVIVADPKTGQLNAVQRYFANDIKKRSERLDEYYRLKEVLLAAYHIPTHSLYPDLKINGKDLYVSGQSHGYHLEWHGPKTIASLKLSDNELVVSFRESPGYTTAN